MKNKSISLIVISVIVLGIIAFVAFAQINNRNENKGLGRGGSSIENRATDFQGEAATINSELEQLEIDEAEIDRSIEELEALEF